MAFSQRTRQKVNFDTCTKASMGFDRPTVLKCIFDVNFAPLQKSNALVLAVSGCRLLYKVGPLSGVSSW